MFSNGLNGGPQCATTNFYTIKPHYSTHLIDQDTIESTKMKYYVIRKSTVKLFFHCMEHSNKAIDPEETIFVHELVEKGPKISKRRGR